MGVEQVQNQCKVTLEIPEARIEEWGLVRHNLYKYFGAKPPSGWLIRFGSRFAQYIEDPGHKWEVMGVG